MAIIGAGVIGASIALTLARRGVNVVVVDALAGAGQGSTSYSSGICRMYYSVLDSVKFAWEGYHYWKHWEEHIGDTRDPRGYAKLTECGALVLQSSATSPFLKRVLPLFDQVRIPYECWDRATVEARYGPQSPFGWDFTCYAPPKRIDHPDFGSAAMGADEVTGAVFFPTTGYVADPQLGCLNLQRAAEQTGRVQFMFGRRVVEILRSSNDTRVEGLLFDDGSKVASRVVVNVAGPHSSQVNAMAFSGRAAELNDMRVTTRALRQEVAYVKAPPGVQYEHGGGVIGTDLDTGIYFRPEVGNKILAGTVEPPCDHPLEFVDDPDKMDLSLTDNHTNYMYRLALRMPALELPGASDAQGIVACYDVTEDWTPIYDRSALGGYYMAIGTSGNQFKNAGVAGALMAELIERCEAGWDQDQQPLQFQLEKSGCGTINTASFSRLRQVLDTSQSVLG